MSIDNIKNELNSLMEDWEVYSPSEEEEESQLGNTVHRGKYNAEEIRNIMMSYFMTEDERTVQYMIRDLIDAVPDEYVVNFLRKQGDTVVKEISESLNEGMWESPFKMKHINKIRDLFANKITFEELDSDDGHYLYFDVIGDDSFWDSIADMAYEFPNNDARPWIAERLREWIDRKEEFNSDSFSDEAQNEIELIIKDFED